MKTLILNILGIVPIGWTLNRKTNKIERRA